MMLRKVVPLLFLLISSSVMVARAHTNSNCYYNIDLEILDECIDIYDTLESALLTPENLYILREAFYPTNDGSHYVLHFIFNMQLPNNATLVVERGWTSSGLLRTLNPIALVALQSGIVLHYLTPVPMITVVLDLQNVTFLKADNHSKLMSTLTLLTTRLKVYTRTTAQDKLNSWDGSDKGFTWDTTDDLSSLHFKYLLLPILIVQLFVLGVIIISARQIKKALSNLSGNKVFGILFWGSMITMVYFYCQKGLLLKGYHETTFFNHYPRMYVFKTFVDWIPLGVGIIMGIVPSIWLCLYTPSPVVLNEQQNKKHCRTCNICYFISLETMYISSVYAAVRVVPTFLLAVVYPLQVIVIATMVISQMVCGPLLFIPASILLSSILSCDFSNCIEKGRLLLFGLLSISVSILVGIMNDLYIAVLHDGTNSGGLLQVLLSIFTTFIIGTFSYTIKRTFLGKKSIAVLLKEGSDDQTEDNSSRIHSDYGSNQASNANPELQHLMASDHESNQTNKIAPQHLVAGHAEP